MKESSEDKSRRMRREQWHETETPDTTHIHNEDVAHEESDVNVRGILWFVVGLAILTAVSFVLMRGLFVLYEMQAEASEPQVAPLARQGDDLLPPEPRLQLAPGHEIHPLEELKELRKKDREELTTYGQVDPATGEVRLPIKVAEEKFLQSNPSARQQQEQPQPVGGQRGAAAPVGGEGEQITPTTTTLGKPNDLFLEIPSYYSSGRKTEKRRQ
ncbi:MAG TPA: hypothetical protein VM870_11065 [Pyrinomonadaceae bacterium]|nr:hypothetical protein [Pyrinomonadaceae bacterium]